MSGKVSDLPLENVKARLKSQKPPIRQLKPIYAPQSRP
jgi:hypothetical protein